MSVDKRYQVFVSSTFDDLQDERKEVIQALLELRAIPAGMELFPAANDDQWTLIKRVIDDCDYYLVIVAGRYGSVGPTGQSYTEMEYRYAVEQKKPVIAFVHKDPASLPSKKCEATPEGRDKLAAFTNLVKKKMVKFWSTPADLGSVVSRSLVALTNNTPAVGWVKADRVPDESASEEILKLRRRVEELEAALAAARTEAPPGTDHLAQGDQVFMLGYSFTSYAKGRRYEHSAECSVTWSNIFAALSPLMIDEARELRLRQELERLAEREVRATFSEHEAMSRGAEVHVSVPENYFQTVKVQLRALGLIVKSTRARSVKDTDTYWTLTPYGDSVMVKLRAIPSGQVSIEEPDDGPTSGEG